MTPDVETAARALARERVLFNMFRDDIRKDPVDVEAAVNYAWRYVDPATAVITALQSVGGPQITLDRATLIRAYGVVEWVASQGYALAGTGYPDADDVYLELAKALGTEAEYATLKGEVP